jgi:hypothetical protein
VDPAFAPFARALGVRPGTPAPLAPEDEAESVRDAVARIGVEQAGRVAGALAAKSLFSPRMKQEFAAFADRWDGLFRRSGTVATTSAELRTADERVARTFSPGGRPPPAPR